MSTFYETSLQYSDFEPDFSTHIAMLYEYATDVMPNSLTRFPTLKYRRRVTPDSALLDTLHREPLPVNDEWETYNLPLLVQANPKRQELTKFGIDEPREITFSFALPVLEEHGLVVQKKRQVIVDGAEQDDPADTLDGGPLMFLVLLGDRVFFQGHEYVIMNVYEDQFFANSEIPTFLTAACNKVQPDTPADATLTDEDDDWRDDPLNES